MVKGLKSDFSETSSEPPIELVNIVNFYETNPPTPNKESGLSIFYANSHTVLVLRENNQTDNPDICILEAHTNKIENDTSKAIRKIYLNSKITFNLLRIHR